MSNLTTRRRDRRHLTPTVRLAGLALAGSALLAGCGGGSSPEAAASPGASPGTSAPAAGPTAASSGSAVPVPSGKPIQVVQVSDRPTTRDDVRRNEAGVPWTLDDTGAQACAYAEFALRAVDEGLGDGADDLAQAQRLALGSTSDALVSVVADFPPAPGRDDAATLLAACTTAGYEL